MAGIVAFYYFGYGGGFKGSDGMGGYELMVEVGAASREWFAIHERYSYNHPPMSVRIRRFIPEGPMHEDSLRIAAILWLSDLFKDCPSYETVKRELEAVEEDCIDFNCKINVPEHFYDLLEETRSVDISDKISIYGNSLYDVTLDRPYRWREY